MAYSKLANLALLADQIQTPTSKTEQPTRQKRSSVRQHCGDKSAYAHVFFVFCCYREDQAKITHHWGDQISD